MAEKGRISARLAQGDGDLARAQALRHLCFHAARGLSCASGRDGDAHDERCRHVLIEDRAGRLLACYRVFFMQDGRSAAQSYAAGFYDLTRLSGFPGPLMELGRFCIHPDAGPDPDILRLAWGALAGLVEASAAQMLVGCSSFDHADPARHAPALASLGPHIGPQAWRPDRRAGETVAIPLQAASGQPVLPPLLRSYLAMGGWVSDHAVVDRALDTLHVFTAVEVARIPPARARALRALAVKLT